MIVDALWSIVAGLLSPLIGLLPTTDFAETLSGQHQVRHWLLTADLYVPVITPLGLLIDVLSVGVLFVPLALGVWIWKLIPGKMT